MSQQRGFTIVEVVLFLAVSGFLTVALLTGAGAAVQRQQYRDAVQSFANYLRGQYSHVVNVENDRPQGKCPINGADGGSATNRGQSNCVVVGRYIETVGSGTTITGEIYRAHPVYAYQPGAGSKWQYSLGEGSDSNVNWSARTRLASGDGKLSMLIYRSPDTGGIKLKIFNEQFTETNLDEAFATKTNSGTEICVYDTNWMSGERMSVFVSPHAGSTDAITVANAGEECRNAN